MVALIDRRSRLALALVMALLLSLAPSSVMSEYPFSSYLIETEEFHWDVFPLRVLVDMNQWSAPDYATAVHEALDNWMGSIAAYTDLYGGVTLKIIRYAFYLSNVNSTGSYDVFMTFAASEMPPASGTVGATTFKWDEESHEPVAPIIINITTYSRTASFLFVKNVAMHEFGHALGLGHAYSRDTSNGPELMYPRSAKDQVVYPSTLDVYALTVLYEGGFRQVIQLPSSIPYELLSNGNPPPAEAPFWESYFRYVIILVSLLFVVGVGLALWRVRRKAKPEEPMPEPPPLVPSAWTER